MLPLGDDRRQHATWAIYDAQARIISIRCAVHGRETVQSEIRNAV